jgi:hypothetical protein
MSGDSGDPDAAIEQLRRLATDVEREYGIGEPFLLALRRAVALFTARAGDPVAALALAEGILADAERELPDNDRFRGSIRALCDDLRIEVLTASATPLPRELRQVVRAAVNRVASRVARQH